MRKEAHSYGRRAAAVSWFDRNDPRVGDQVAGVGARRALAGLLEASVQENVDTMLHILSQRMELAAVDPPTAAVEYARRLAQRDVAVVALIRAYRIGQTQFLRLCIEDLILEQLIMARGGTF